MIVAVLKQYENGPESGGGFCAWAVGTVLPTAQAAATVMPAAAITSRRDNAFLIALPFSACPGARRPGRQVQGCCLLIVIARSGLFKK
jgi:hypothetical protein